MDARVNSTVQSLQRIVVCRIKPGADFVEALRQICTEQGIRQGLIVTGIGSFHQAVLMVAAPRGDRKIGYGHSEPLQIQGPLSLLSCQGTIALDEKAQPAPHVHAALALPDGGVVGGDLTRGCVVMATVEIGILQLSGPPMRRLVVPETGTPHLVFAAATDEAKPA